MSSAWVSFLPTFSAVCVSASCQTTWPALKVTVFVFPSASVNFVLRTGERINHVIGMRMHGEFLARLDADIHDAHLLVVQEHLEMCRINFHRVLGPGCR